MAQWNELAQKSTIERTMKALGENGIQAYFIKSGQEAYKKVFELLPENAEVMNMTSITLETLGIAKTIMESGKYISVKKKLVSMDRKTQNSEMQKMGSAPDWAIGSVHAVTELGQVMVVAQSGSQLASYVYGSSHVIWVVGTQKIVKNLDEGFKRIYDYCLPLESDRAKKAYGVPGSSVNKVFILNKEIKPGRITLIFVHEVLGF